MDDLRTAPTVGIVGCVLYLVALAVPYLLVETTSAVGAYYDSGALSPVIPGVFALVAIIVFAASIGSGTGEAIGYPSLL